MNEQFPIRIVKKAPILKGTTKYHEGRTEKVKKAVFDYIQDNGGQFVSYDQIYIEGKNQWFREFADFIKKFLEKTNTKNFPIFTIEEYVLVLRGLYTEQKK